MPSSAVKPRATCISDVKFPTSSRFGGHPTVFTDFSPFSSLETLHRPMVATTRRCLLAVLSAAYVWPGLAVIVMPCHASHSSPPLPRLLLALPSSRHYTRLHPPFPPCPPLLHLPLRFLARISFAPYDPSPAVPRGDATVCARSSS